MKLLTKENMKQLPPLYAQEGKGYESIAYVKLFTPDSDWTWYVTEFDPDTKTCFGLVDGFEKELGYFSLNELENVKGIMGLNIERDRWFTPKTLSKIIEEGN